MKMKIKKVRMDKIKKSRDPPFKILANVQN